MSKAEKALVIITGNPFTVVKTKTGETLKLNAAFEKELIAAGNEVGGFIRTAEQKAKLSLNLVAAFAEYKRITKNGLPAFVCDVLHASDCPRSYGKVGSDERKKLNGHTLFNGIEYMHKKGQALYEKMKEQKALADAGIDTEDPDAISEHNKETRDAKRDAFQSAFTRVVVQFDKFGVTETTISNLLILMGKHEKDAKDELNKVGITLRDAAIKAVFADRAKSTRDVTPTPAAPASTSKPKSKK